MKKKVIFLCLIVVVLLGCCLIYQNKETLYINSVLKQKYYSYLPDEAKEYVKEVYRKSGEVILTEKNKEKDKLYLNPQYVLYLAYSDKEKEETGDIPVPMVLDYSSSNIDQSVEVPSSYDLRNVNGNNYVTPVRNQGSLGICWTFATAGAIESHLLKKNNTSYLPSSKLISERQIDYATSRNGIKDYKNEYVSFINRFLGDGGNFYISTVALANGISSIDYNSFKEYNDRDLNKMELSDVINYSKSLYEVDSTINFPRMNFRDSTSILTNEEAKIRDNYLKEVKQNIIKNGASYVGTYMGSQCQYVDPNLKNTVIDVYNCNITGGHAMEIIGWDDDVKYSYCADTAAHDGDISNCQNVVSGKGVWILKNSWGSDVQYPYLTYDSLYTAISFIDELESSENRNWDNNYILGDGSEDVKTQIYSLNDTKIQNDEKLKKLKFITENSKTEYNVKIKKKDGTYKIFSKTSNLPGLMTIDITEDILVSKNTEITVYSENEFIDKVSIFTSNSNMEPYIDLSKYENKEIDDDDFRLYSDTKNIPSGSEVTYKIYNSSNQDVSNDVSFTNNVVAENNINTLVSFGGDLESGKYRIDAIYDSNVIGTVNIDVVKMAGLGSKNNPYIITNTAQLYKIRDDLDAYYELGNDIDLTEDTRDGGKYSLESSLCSQSFGWEAINGFSGSLDGKGHTLKGLYQKNFITCNDEKEPWWEWNDKGNGLFGSMKGNVTVKNLVLEDFDITCQGGRCGALVSRYTANMRDDGYIDYSDSTEYTATFENIAIKNSKIKGVYNDDYHVASDRQNSYGGGLFGVLESFDGNINISNIYLDINLILKDMDDNGYLASSIHGNEVNVQNIRLLGDLQGQYLDGNGDAILIHTLSGSSPIRIKNVISTVTATKVMGSLLGKNWNNSLFIDGVNLLNIEDKPLCYENSCLNTTNVNVYNKDTQLVEFTKQGNYNSWDGFSNNWEIKTIDGIPRIPVLKFMDFEYTKISDILLNQILNKKVSIYDYLTPKVDAAKRIIYKSNDENVVTMEEDGTIVPQSTGNTTIHVESLYDGYIKDVPISVKYVPHYTINFDANGGTGEMDSIEVEAGKKFKLPKNDFVKEYYELKEWNTKADGTGTSYAELSELPAMNDKESITLYAIWWGEERIVTFDAAGGTVSPERKTVRVGQKYGELPIPVRDGYGFHGWGGNNIYINAFSQLRTTQLIASWKPDAYTIIYDANGGTIKSEYKKTSAVYLHSETIATTFAFNDEDKDVYDCLYEREGYRFKEWNTKADGTGTSYDTEGVIKLSSVDNSVLRLYAIWEEKDSVSPTVDIKVSSYNTFNWTASDNIAVTGYAITTSATEPTTWITDGNMTSGTYSIDVNSKKTYYVWAKDKDGNIRNASIGASNLNTIVGKGTSLVLRNGDSNGAIISTPYVLNGTKIHIKATLLSGYSSLILNVDNNKFTSGNTYLVNSNTKITSIAAPGAPKNVIAKLYGYDDVKFSWTSVSGAKGYLVYYKKSSSTSWTKYTGTIYTSGTTKYVKKANLIDGIKYNFKVYSYLIDVNGDTQKSEGKLYSIYTLKKMSAPVIKKVSTSKIRISYTKINGVTGYQISQSTSKTGTRIVSKIIVKKNKKYYYKVRAYKTVDGKKIYGPWSNVRAYTLR